MKDLSSKEIQIDSEIVDKAAKHVFKLFKEKLSDDFQYHSIDHIIEITKIARDLCKEYKLKTEEVENIVLACLFYATGFTREKENPQTASTEIFNEFADQQKLESSLVKEVNKLIESTSKEKTPENLHEEIIHDAIISEVGRKRFFRLSELMRLERKLVYGEEFTEEEWEEERQNYLAKNDFYTLAAKKEYGSRRAKNIRRQRNNIVKGEKVSLRKNTGKDLGRGVDTLYRSAYRNHINLSSIADEKANMMISINTVILSVIVTLSGAGLSFTNNFIIEHLRFVVPIFVLLVSSLASVVFAVMSAKPDVSENELSSLDEIDMKTNSLLYFGKFTGVDLESFKTYMNKLKLDQRELYDAMSIDLYSLGVVLKKKYKLITTSYNIFMIGLILCVVSFIIIFVYTQSTN